MPARSIHFPQTPGGMAELDLRTYLESEEVWMWIYANSNGEAVNMDHVLCIRLQGEPDKVMVVATLLSEEEVVLKTCHSGGEARDWIKRTLASINARDGAAFRDSEFDQSMERLKNA